MYDFKLVAVMTVWLPGPGECLVQGALQVSAMNYDEFFIYPDVLCLFWCVSMLCFLSALNTFTHCLIFPWSLCTSSVIFLAPKIWYNEEG